MELNYDVDKIEWWLDYAEPLMVTCILFTVFCFMANKKSPPWRTD